MPTYEYLCSACDHRFEIEQNMKDGKKKKCPSCKKYKLKAVIGTPYIFIKGTPQSIEHLADRNTQQMGSYERSEKLAKGKKKKDNDPWWRKDSKYSNSAIKKMSESQRKKFIEDGE